MPKNGVRPPVGVSQNFLTCAKTIRRLILRTSLNENDHVIEIGPGKGHITQALTLCCRRVTAVEIDAALYARLTDKFAGTGNLTLVYRDFLKWNLPVHGGYKVFSNIPFCITTDILRKLTEGKNPPDEAWLIMEKGAAMRFMGRPHETEASLLTKPVFDMNVVYYFSRDDFHPRPSVDVVMLHLSKKTKPDISPEQREVYKNFVTEGMRRGVHGLCRMFAKQQFSRALREAGLKSDFVPGEILYIQWLCLFWRCTRRF